MTQPKVKKRGRKRAAGASVFAAAALIMAQFTPVWEGRRLVPYQDIVGVWTVCEGETRVPMFDQHGKLIVRTEEQCDDMSAGMYQEFLDHVAQVNPGIERYPFMHAGMADTAINIGKAGYTRSSMARNYRGGRFREACRSILKYKYAGGRVVNGLRLRRTGDIDRIGAYEVCLADAVEAEFDAKGITL